MDGVAFAEVSGCLGGGLVPRKNPSVKSLAYIHRRELAGPRRFHHLSPCIHHTRFRPSKPKTVATCATPSQSEPSTPPNGGWWSYLFALINQRAKQVLKPDWSQYHLPSPGQVVWKTGCVLFAMVALALIMCVLDSGLMKMYQYFFVKS
ncbi:hypothetical protein BSKO_13210 [Bryopsis sp. KO-2023]|nr:hypothetical protein BSKO_13210 [Bryopsis sp. KO-2023]